MRILFLISSSGFYGAEAAVANLAVGLRRLGCTAVVASMQNRIYPENGFEKRIRALGIDVVSVPCRSRLDRATVRWIRDFARVESFDVLHAHGYKADLHGLWAGRRMDAMLVATCHNWTGGGLRDSMYDFVDHVVLTGFSRIVAVSDAVRRSLRAFGIPDWRISVIANGVDLRRFTRPAAGIAGEVNIRCGAVVGFVGRLVPDKGVDLLLHSMRVVLRSHPETVVIIAGDGPARADLERLSTQLGIEGNVRFMGARSDVEALYSVLDVVVLPSRNEGAPMTVMEAMAAGRAVVATRVGGVPDIVVDGESGLLVQPDDIGGLAKALECLLADGDQRAAMGTQGRRLAEARHSAESVARRYLDVYLSARSGAPVSSLC